jgi:uncharacterized protein with HEPN domain
MNDTSITTRERLLEIIESIDLITSWSEQISQPVDFLTTPQNVMAFNACVMRLQVIGEHVGKLLKNDSNLLDRHNEIPWMAIYDMRNIISHEYSHIDEEVVYSTVKDDLPALKSTIEQMLNDIQ